MDLIVDVISIGEPWGIFPGFAISDEWGHDRLDAYGGHHGWRELRASGFTSADLDEALHHSPCTTETLPDFFVLELFVVKGWGLGGKLMRSGLHRRGNPVIVLKLWHGGYPTLGKGKSSSHVPFLGDMLVPRRGSFFFFSEKNPTQPNFKFWSFGGSHTTQNQLQKISSSQIRMDFRGEPQSLTKRQLSWEKIRCSWGYPIQITWVFMGRTPSYRSVSRFPLGEDPRSTDPGIPGRDQIHLCLRSWSSQKQSSIGTLGEKKQVASMGEGQGYQSLSKVFYFWKRTHLPPFFCFSIFFSKTHRQI